MARRTVTAGRPGILALYIFTVPKAGNRNVVAIRRPQLTAVLGEPAAEHRIAPLLPLLDVALRTPGLLRGALLRLLPGKHRLYVWSPDEC